MGIYLADMNEITVIKLFKGRQSSHWVVPKSGIRKITGWTGSKNVKTYTGFRVAELGQVFTNYHSLICRLIPKI